MGNAITRWFYNPRYNWIGLILSLAVMFFCFLFVLPAFLSGNPLWAFNTIPSRPIQAILYTENGPLIFEPGSKDYDLLVNAAYDAIYKQVGVSDVGWNEQRFAEARQDGLALELIYNEPVKLPGRRIDISDPTRLFFPLDVFGWTNSSAYSEVIFRGGERSYWGLPIHAESLDPVREAAQQVLANQ